MRSLVLISALLAATVLAIPTPPPPSSRDTGKQVTVQDSTTPPSSSNDPVLLSAGAVIEAKKATDREYRALKNLRNYNDYLLFDQKLEPLLAHAIPSATIDDIHQAIQQARNTYLLNFRTTPFDHLLEEELKPLVSPMDLHVLPELVWNLIREARKNCDKDYSVRMKELKEYNDSWRMDDLIVSILLQGDSVDAVDADTFIHKMRSEYVKSRKETTSDAPKFEKMLELSKTLLETRHKFPISSRAKEISDDEFAQELAKALPKYEEKTISEAVKKARNTLYFELAVTKRKPHVLSEIIESDELANIPESTFFKNYAALLAASDKKMLKILDGHRYATKKNIAKLWLNEDKSWEIVRNFILLEMRESASRGSKSEYEQYVDTESS